MGNLNWQSHVKFLSSTLCKTYYMISSETDCKHPYSLEYIFCAFSIKKLDMV